MSELDKFAPRPEYNGRKISAAEVMIQALHGEFESIIHANMARDNGILPKNYRIKSNNLPPAMPRRYNRVRFY